MCNNREDPSRLSSSCKVGDDDEEGERCAKWIPGEQSELALSGHCEGTVPGKPSRSADSNRDR